MSNQFLSELREKRKVHEVMELRRKCLDIARGLIDESPESEGMSPEEIELAACDLCDRQMKDLTPVS